MFEDEEKFPLLKNPEGLDRLNRLKNYTEICFAWRAFLKLRPEAKRFETELNPAPWTKIGAQPFFFVKDSDLEALFERWSAQVDVLIALS